MLSSKYEMKYCSWCVRDRLVDLLFSACVRCVGFSFIWEWQSAACQNPDVSLCIIFVSENFIKNFSILYSPLKRHLVDGTSVRVPAERVVAEVTTSTFHHIVFSSEKVLLAVGKSFCKSLLTF